MAVLPETGATAGPGPVGVGVRHVYTDLEIAVRYVADMHALIARERAADAAECVEVWLDPPFWPRSSRWSRKTQAFLGSNSRGMIDPR